MPSCIGPPVIHIFYNNDLLFELRSKSAGKGKLSVV